MGNFEKLSVLVIVVIIVMILVVALYTLTEDPDDSLNANTDKSEFVSDEENWDPVPDEEDDVTLPPDRKEEDDVTPTPEPPKDIVEPGKDPLAKDLLAKSDTEDDVGEEIGKEWWYVVQSGDTLGEIAMKHLTTMTRYPEIVRLNPGIDPNNLQIGTKLKMPAKGAKKPGGRTFRELGTEGGRAIDAGGGGSPAPGTHYVTKSGDQLQRISKLAYGTIERWPDIYAKNFSKISNPERLQAGIRIFLPE